MRRQMVTTMYNKAYYLMSRSRLNENQKQKTKLTVILFYIWTGQVWSTKLTEHIHVWGEN